MEPFEQIFANKIPSFEGFCFWPYLDTHKPPLVTIAVGCYITLSEAVTLPFTISAVPATQDQIEDNYSKVQHMKGGMVAKNYHYPNCLILPDVDCKNLTNKRIVSCTSELKSVFPNFASLTDNAKSGLLDMMFNLGPGNFAKYQHMIALIKSGNMVEAANQSGRDATDPAFNERNAWVHQQLIS